MVKKILAVIMLLVLWQGVGCRSAGSPHDDSSAAPIVSSAPEEHNFPDLSEEFGGRDSCEGFNRSMFAVNKYGGKYVMQPLAIFWGSLIPRYGIDCFNRFTDNLAFPKRTFSSLCQAKFKGAGIDFSRFLINVTVGIAGFFDPASHWFDLEYQDEDFGQAFAVWGCGPGPTLHLPGIGQTNIRDGIGKIFDYAFDPKTYITGGQGFTMLNEGTSRYREFDSFLRTYRDPYELSKRLYYAQRYIKIHDYDYRDQLAAYQKTMQAEAADIPGDLNPVNPPVTGLPGLAVPGFV
ncbi:MAG: VacJ family lipoprotein, partial [Victivallales bacterium]|nr:VacJ family lipoprotein [Victivallales bacterium]